MAISKLEQMFDELKGRESKRLVVANANDSHTIEAVNKAVELDLIKGILVGDENEIAKVCNNEKIDIKKFKIVHVVDEQKASDKAVEIIANGEADLLMKGLVSTDVYMRSILKKEYNFLPKGSVLSHITVMQNPNYHKLLIVGDVAIIPLPELKEKIAITNYLIETALALGIKNPKVAAIAASEKVSPKMPASVDASLLSKMAERGQIKNAVVEGPIGFDVAIDKESADIKNIKSEVAGNADCILFPNIESGNVFYKTNTKLANAELAAIVLGAKAPAILSSRGDNVKTKLYSIALGALLA
ncbi:MAG: bifunctional enoyl-CoA hydratase/phosphate acetyltransferase [Bacteroidota bacterium]|nr:bifunctional enoyl-CoA hydratase/phosphate acetyltransferase [Bacteroidota bacterium]